MYKLRMYENIFLRNYGKEFKNDIVIPYIEIIELKLGRKDVAERDIVEYLDSLIESNYFIDFFTFDEGKYTQINKEKLIYSALMRTEEWQSYLSRLLETTFSQKAIPVISIKSARERVLDVEVIEKLISKLQLEKEKIAVRVEGNIYENYSLLFKKVLRDSDILFFDIREDNIDPYILDVMDVTSNVNYQTVIANSPRKKSVNNNSYLESGYTKLIDNYIREEYKVYGFDAYSDYSGLKDDLPKSGGGIFGSAIAMIFDHSKNEYYTITNKDTTRGIKGYKEVLEELSSDKIVDLLDLRNCNAFRYIEENLIKKERNGTYSTWNLITLIRMLSEIKKSTDYYL